MDITRTMAYINGRFARLDGFPINDNPYHPDSYSSYLYRKGWRSI